jgi:hypothetical protein
VAAEDLLGLFPNAEPALSSTLIEKRFNDHPLLLNPGNMSERIQSQIQSLVQKFSNGKLLAVTMPTVKRLEFAGDVWEFNGFNREKLKDIAWETSLRKGVDWLRAMAFRLRDCQVLCELGHHEHLPERHLIVLDSE